MECYKAQLEVACIAGETFLRPGQEFDWEPVDMTAAEEHTRAVPRWQVRMLGFWNAVGFRDLQQRLEFASLQRASKRLDADYAYQLTHIDR